MGNGFAHIELTTTDVAKAKKFYKGIFKWKLNDVKGMPYTMIDTGGQPGGGLQAQPLPNAPVAWLPYVEVESVKKTVAKAQKAGAQIAIDYMDIGENGAIGIFIDPLGAMLGVWEQKKKEKKAKKKKGKKK
jgi:predicted enzyme related to lactoylglutathione lyase